MADSEILDFVTIAIIIGLCVYLRMTTPSKADLGKLDNPLAHVLHGLGERLHNLDETAERMLSSVPQVNLTNQNPLISIIEAFQTLRGHQNQLNAVSPLRDSHGRFDEYGTKENENENTESETEVFID